MLKSKFKDRQNPVELGATPAEEGSDLFVTKKEK